MQFNSVMEEICFKSFHYNIETQNATALQEQRVSLIILCIYLVTQHQQRRLPGAACEVLDPAPTAKPQTIMNTQNSSLKLSRSQRI